MNRLEEIEAIKQLKYRYFRALDTNDWELMKSCLTEDCESWYSSGKYSFQGREAIVGFLSESMSGDHFLTMHHGHHPEIEVQSDTTATGTWYLEDQVIDLKHQFTLTGGAFYRDEYVKQDGSWRIRKTGYDRTFEQIEPRRSDQQILQNMFRR